jgi:hypothetical protein
MMVLKNKIKAWLGPIWWYSIILFVAQRFGDVLNIYIGLWLVPKYVAQDQLGALLPLTQIAGVLGLPLAIILIPFTKFINTFGAKEEYGKIKALLLDVLIVVGISSVIIGIYTWHVAPLIFDRLRISSTRLISDETPDQRRSVSLKKIPYHECRRICFNTDPLGSLVASIADIGTIGVLCFPTRLEFVCLLDRLLGIAATHLP